MKITKETEKKITDLISQMTPEEKVLQMIQISDVDFYPEGTYEKFIKLGAGSFLHVLGKDTAPIIEAAKHTRMKIPPIFGIDAIHGHAFLNGAVIFPSQLGMACSWNTDLIEKMGVATAEEVNADGLDWIFSPVLCLGRDTRWGRIDETFGEDAFLAGKLGAAIVCGYEKDSLIISCLKHYIGYGEATGGKDSYDTEVTMRKIRETFLPPFAECVKAGAGSVMTAYGSIDGTPLTVHKELLTDVLKGELGFEGFVVTDWMNISHLIRMQHAAADFNESSRKAVEAGNDMTMNRYEFFDCIVNQVRDGTIDEKYLDESVRRILRAKFAIGLFDENKKRMPKSVIGCREHVEINHALTRESLVLLKNDGILPISEGTKKIAVIGPNADDIVSQCGDWTMFTHRPEEERKEIKNDQYTLLRGVKEIFSDSEIIYARGCSVRGAEDDGAEIAKAVAAAEAADAVILAFGDDCTQNGEMKDRAVLELSGRQNELIRRVKAAGKPLIGVLISGKPLCIGEAAENCDALITGFNSGDLGGLCTAELIAGKFNPSGKLPISFPRASGQIPCYYSEYPGWHTDKYCDLEAGNLFDFGFGLSYTKFEYSSLAVSAQEISADEDITVSVKIKNIGDRDGAETAELYINDVVSSVITPVKLLRGFCKVFIPAGEDREVSFALNARDLGFIAHDGKLTVEPGKFEIFVGGSLSSLLKTEIYVK